MYKAKKLIKGLLPKAIRQPLLNQYHLMTAVAANMRYGFPAKEMRIIMITGTNGKTTTACLIAEMLTQAGYKVGLNTTAFYSYPGHYEPKASSRTLGDIFELQSMFAQMKRAGCEFVVLEATSQGLEQNRLWGVPCDVAVMTNLTQDHLDYHGTMDNYAAAKAKLFAHKPRIIVLNHDDEWFDYFNAFLAKERKVNYGTTSDATVQIADVKLAKDGSDIKLVFDGAQVVKVHTNLVGKFNVYNATAAAAVGYYLQLEPEQVAKGIAALTSVPGRLQRVDAGQPFEVVIDYAHTPDALQNVLSTLKRLTKGKLVAVFGATGDRDRGKRPIMGKIAAAEADRIIVTDEESYSEDPATIRKAVLAGVKEAKGKATEVADRRDAMRRAFTTAARGDIVVVTGMGHELSRNMGGEATPWNDADVAREVLAELGYKKKK